MDISDDESSNETDNDVPNNESSDSTALTEQDGNVNLQEQPVLPPEATDSDDVEVQEVAENTILSLIWYRGKVAAAFYDLQSSQIFVVPDSWDWQPYFRLTKCLYRQIQPYRVITINKINENISKVLVTLITGVETKTIEKIPKELQFLRRKMHIFETCKRKALSVQLLSEPPNLNDDERNTFISTLLDFSNSLMIHALGILLMYVEKNWGFLQRNGGDDPVFSGINIVSLEKLVVMDDETFKAIQVFSPQDHPANFNKGKFNKEGLSLFSLFNHCQTIFGTRKLRDFFVHPTNDKKVLEDRHKVMSFFMNPGNETILKNLKDSLNRIKNLNPILLRISGMSAGPRQWKIFYECLNNLAQISELLNHHKDKADLFNQICSAADQDIYHIVGTLTTVLDIHASVQSGNVTIKEGVDAALDDKKEVYNKLYVTTTEITKQEIKKLPIAITSCQIIYYPEVGFLLAVDQWKDEMSREDIDSLGFEFMFVLNKVIFYRSSACQELDSHIGDIFISINIHQERIILRLVRYIEKYFFSIQKMLNNIAELDCLITMASVCSEYEYVKPTLTEDNVIRLSQCRHPVFESQGISFVSNDYVSDTENGLVKIVTGANASGKSVYLKQIAAVVYLAHIGSFIPAASATIGLLDNIHTRIKSMECVIGDNSMFLNDLQQMTQSLCTSTSRSLIIFDEFGKGTSELDGVALLSASLESFIKRDDQCPHIVSSTHLSKITLTLQPSPLVKFQMMEHMLDGKNHLVFLYKVIDGCANSSCAIDVATTEHYPPSLVTRMHEIYASISEGSDIRRRNRPRLELQQRKAQHVISSICEAYKQDEDLEKIDKLLEELLH